MCHSGTTTGLLFPLSLPPTGDHFSTRSAARKRNRLRDGCGCVFLSAKQQHCEEQEDGSAQPSADASKLW